MPDLRQRKQEERFKTKDSLRSVQDVAAGFAQNLQNRADGDGAGEQADTYAVDKLEERVAGVVQRATQTPEQVVSRARNVFLKQRRDTAANNFRGPSSKLPDGAPQSKNSSKEKQAPQPKTRSQAEQFRQRPTSHYCSARTTGQSPASSRAAEQGRKKYTQTAQKKMSQRTQKTAKKAVSLGKKAATAVLRTVASGIGMLTGTTAGIVLMVVLCVVVLIGGITATPLGIFFSSWTAAESVPLASAVAQIHMDYGRKLARLQEGEYDRVELAGTEPDWCEVVAVFACAVSGKDHGMDVTTLDAKRVDWLKSVFWDMCSLSSSSRVIKHPDSDPDDGADDAWEEVVLTITISTKTAATMGLEYGFDQQQNQALEILLAEKALLQTLLSNLETFQADALTLLQSLPDDLPLERKTVVHHALSLVGKVNYFWGGKSRVLGWDSRWGRLQLVWAEGSETTGTYRPFGLDCSGFVDWVFYNASGGEYLIGHGGGVYEQHTYCTDIPWEEAQPGDLVFFADDSHVGIVGGWDEGGNLLAVHCGSGANNVVIEEVGVAGFTVVARPVYYDETTASGLREPEAVDAEIELS